MVRRGISGDDDDDDDERLIRLECLGEVMKTLFVLTGLAGARPLPWECKICSI